MSVFAAVLVGLLVAVAFLAFGLAGRGLPARIAAFACVGVLAVLAVVVVLSGDLTGPDSLVGRLLVLELALAAVVAGSPVTATVLWLVDRGSSRTDSMELAGEVLRGGAWIGAFERAAVFAALAAGWPEGLAVVLALKGLGRYSELRGTPGDPTSGTTPVSPGGVAERFIIGTFASVLWACACAGAYLALVG